MKIKRREILEWGILIVIAGTLYLTGLHTEVLGTLQRVMLTTGIITPDLDEAKTPASYDLMLEDFDGNQISFSTFREKKVFLNFWATWCPPCIAEMPDIHDLYEKMGKDVSFVMISMDKDRDKAKAFINDKEFDFPVYFLTSSLPAVYNPRSIPTTYVISPQGEIVVTRHGMAKYDTKKFRSFLEKL